MCPLPYADTCSLQGTGQFNLCWLGAYPPPAPLPSPLASGGCMRGRPQASPRSCSLPMRAAPRRPTSAGFAAPMTPERSFLQLGSPARSMLSASPFQSAVSGPRPTQPTSPPLVPSRRRSWVTIGRWSARPHRGKSSRSPLHSALRRDVATGSWTCAWACSRPPPRPCSTHLPRQVQTHWGLALTACR